MLIQNRKILLLKNFAVLAQQLVSFFIVLAVFCHFVNEKQGKRLDAQFEKFLLFFKVRRIVSESVPGAIVFGNVAVTSPLRMVSPFVKVTTPVIGSISDTTKPLYCSIFSEI